MPKYQLASPLRYPGGKGSLANFFKLVIKHNDLLDGDYVELYAGGAGVAWQLLFEEYVRRVHINDINRPLYCFWRSVIEDTENLCRLIYDTPVTVEQWCKQKKIFSNQNIVHSLELGFSLFFLNRCNRSGILNGGIIGGKEQQGEWKIDARFNKVDLVERIYRIARYRGRINIYNLDAANFISEKLSDLPSKTLLYLDPPYYFKGRNLYEDHYAGKDHKELSKLVKKKVKLPWVVSYDNVEEIRTLYRAYSMIEYKLDYSARERQLGSEVMYFSNKLKVPNVENPSGIKMSHKNLPLF